MRRRSKAPCRRSAYETPNRRRRALVGVSAGLAAVLPWLLLYAAIWSIAQILLLAIQYGGAVSRPSTVSEVKSDVVV